MGRPSADGRLICGSADEAASSADEADPQMGSNISISGGNLEKQVKCPNHLIPAFFKDMSRGDHQRSIISSQYRNRIHRGTAKNYLDMMYPFCVSKITL